MAKAYYIEFTPASTANLSTVTRFGGQPCWIDQAEWPKSKTSGTPMRFICQVALSDVAGVGA